jgi:SAM-dependent methyltransferase
MAINFMLYNWLVKRKCDRIYQNICGFTLAVNARTQQQLFSYEYIYGEINYQSFIKLLNKCEITSRSIFYDLGSGLGKAVICAALLYDFKKVCGIEQLQLLHEQAKLAEQQTAKNNIHFYHADILTHDWHDADIIFINASAYIGDFWQQLLKKLIELKKGTQIIVVSKLLPEEYFTVKYSDFMPMSCGIVRVGVYEMSL